MLLRSSIAVVVAAAIVAFAGCGTKKNDLAPAACLVGNEGYLRALERAPAEVRLAGTTPISDCLVPEQAAGQLANIGQAMIVAATKLNAQARNGSAPATLQLGYLIGAVAKGADAIHTDLSRRLNSAARFSQTGGTLSASFERAFGRGYAAGHRFG
ncbi:MAG: hypothetical protein WB771_03865 [Solirubrobacterales bacterium]